MVLIAVDTVIHLLNCFNLENKYSKAGSRSSSANYVLARLGGEASTAENGPLCNGEFNSTDADSVKKFNITE